MNGEPCGIHETSDPADDMGLPERALWLCAGEGVQGEVRRGRCTGRLCRGGCAGEGVHGRVCRGGCAKGAGLLAFFPSVCPSVISSDGKRLCKFPKKNVTRLPAGNPSEFLMTPLVGTPLPMLSEEWRRGGEGGREKRKGHHPGVRGHREDRSCRSPSRQEVTWPRSIGGRRRRVMPMGDVHT